MKAVGVKDGSNRPELMQIPQPTPGEGEALIRTLRVGVDGTDREVIAGNYGASPRGQDRLILGHEAVGVVEHPNGTTLNSGDIVVPTVRRPPPEGANEYFQRGDPDMAPPEMTLECGINGADGFMREYFTSQPEYLVEITAETARWGFLIEPVSVLEKALELALSSRSSFQWSPETVLVLGNGSLGLLTVSMLADSASMYCLGRRDRPDPTVDIIERLGAVYVDSRETPVTEMAAGYEPTDLVFEATGHAKHALHCVDALAPTGVGVLLGVPDPTRFEIDGARFHKEMVLNNKALIGSVNAGKQHFDAAVDTVESFPSWFLDAFVTTVAPVESFRDAFATGDDVIKTAVEFDSV